MPSQTSLNGPRRGSNGPPPDYLIVQRRKEEELRRDMLETTQFFQNSTLMSQFEQSSAKIHAENRIRRRYAELQQDQNEQLEARRDRLRQQLASDQLQQAQQLESLEETVDQRIARMRARVQELAAKKEHERKLVVEEKMKLKWRAGCDELRQVESKLLEKEVAEKRAVQLVEKQMQKAKLVEETRHYDQLWEEDRLKKVHREQVDNQKRLQRNAEMIAMLNEQVQSLRAKAQEELQLKMEEALLMRHDMEMRKMEEERKVYQKAQEQRKVHQELSRFNRLKMQEKAKAAQASLAFDLQMMEQVHRQQQQERDLARKKKLDLHAEMQAYHHYLVEHKQMEAQLQREVDAMYHDESEKAWQKKEEKLVAQQRQRDRLMAEVLADRQQQIRQRVAANLAEQEAVRKEKARLQLVFEQAKVQERQEVAAKAVKMAGYRDTLAEQIADLEQRRLAEEERVQREIAAFQAQERQYVETMIREIEAVKQGK